MDLSEILLLHLLGGEKKTNPFFFVIFNVYSSQQEFVSFQEHEFYC